MSDSQPGEPVAAAFPHLASAYPTARFKLRGGGAEAPVRGARSALFSAAPHGVSAGLLDRLLTASERAGTTVRSVDISADFRYPSAAAYAHSTATSTQRLRGWRSSAAACPNTCGK